MENVFYIEHDMAWHGVAWHEVGTFTGHFHLREIDNNSCQSDDS